MRALEVPHPKLTPDADEPDEEEINEKKEKQGNSFWKAAGRFLLKTTLVSGAVIGGVAIALPAIGFGSLGVTAGSLAAAYQSSVLGGTIASGSVFATLQSVGAVGLSAAAKTGIVAGSAAVSGATSAFSKRKSNTKN